MNSPKYRVRRATLDDVGELVALWKTMSFSVDELAKRTTEFQVAEGDDGQLVGAVGLQLAERQGLVHSEAFTDFALADPLRPLLWERIHSVATNHGLLRLWTREQAPFWTHCGLTKADDEALVKLPTLWRGQSRGWLTLRLKDPTDAIISADKEFAVFMASEKERSARALQQARVLKFIATLVAIALFGVVLAGAIYLLRQNPSFLRRQ
jgi:N-acetylglutamate synthase-like GNAT family acetyltransferase